jgi:hypothetical protein
MPYMLQPKNYIEIGRPNLYNVAYRRVGAYKGMGRLNPTNYLDIGRQPNRIGGTTGQYNTLSGQLSLGPPSLRGLGFCYPAGSAECQSQSVPIPEWDWDLQRNEPSWWKQIDEAIAAGRRRAAGQPGAKSPLNLGLLLAIGAGLVVVIAASRK